MLRALLLIVGALAGFLFASSKPSEASVWQKGCQPGASFSTTSSSANGILCTTPTSATDDTQVLGVQDCENIDVGLVEDSNGDGTGATALTVTLQWCPVHQNDTVVNTDAERDAACVDYSSGTLTGDGTLQGAGIPSGWIRLNLGGTFAGDPKLWLKCNGAR